MTRFAETRVRVRYAETDQMGVVYHANYLVWFEVGRVEMMRSLHLEYRRLEEDFGCMIAVAEAQVRYKLPARYDDELVVRTGVRTVRGSLLRLVYEVVRATDGALLCTGETVHVVVGRDMKRTTLPEVYARAFRGMAEGAPVAAMPEDPSPANAMAGTAVPADAGDGPVQDSVFLGS